MTWKRPIQLAAAAAAAAILAGLTAATGNATPRPATAAGCRPLTLPVQLAGSPAHVTGQLCVPATRIRGWQLLISGFTYNRLYWEAPGQSYRAAANQAGWITLAIDRPGTTPAPPWPPAADLTIPAQAAAIGQIIGDFRWLGKPVLVTHSLGSAIGVTLAAAHPGDLRALVLSGWAHAQYGPGTLLVRSMLTPAAPDFPGRPAGYVTTSTRRWFYNPADVAAGMEAFDFTHMRATGAPGTELAGIPVTEDPALSRQIPAALPVEVTVGQFDNLNCDPAGAADPALSCASAGALAAREAGDWAGRPVFYVLPGAGHDVATAGNGAAWTAAVLAFASRSLYTPGSTGRRLR